MKPTRCDDAIRHQATGCVLFRYMEWYNPHKMSTASRSGTIFVDQDQEANDNSNSGAATLEEDDESGIRLHC